MAWLSLLHCIGINYPSKCFTVPYHHCAGAMAAREHLLVRCSYCFSPICALSENKPCLQVKLQSLCKLVKSIGLKTYRRGLPFEISPCTWLWTIKGRFQDEQLKPLTIIWVELLRNYSESSHPHWTPVLNIQYFLLDASGVWSLDVQ